MSKLKKNPEEKLKSPKERFLRAIGLPLLSSDHWKSYRIEELIVQDGEIVSRRFLEKPDTKQMTLAKMELLIDPDSVDNEIK